MCVPGGGGSGLDFRTVILFGWRRNVQSLFFGCFVLFSRKIRKIGSARLSIFGPRALVLLTPNGDFGKSGIRTGHAESGGWQS